MLSTFEMSWLFMYMLNIEPRFGIINCQYNITSVTDLN